MLLSLMRKHAKSWLIKSLIAIIAIVFVFYFGYSFRSRTGVKVAYVNGDLISGGEYDKAYRSLVEQLQREYKGLWNENLIKVFDLKNRAMQNLINQKLVSQEAKRLGLDVTEKEIQERIMSYPAFQSRGQFDEARYQAMLQNNRMKPEDFETMISQELLHGKMQEFLMTFLPVTDKEILDQYTYANRKVKVSYVQFLSDPYKNSVKMDQAGLEKYFEEHKEKYRIPEKVKIAYVVFDPEAYKKDLKVDEQQMKDYYEDNIEKFKEKKQVKAKHILFKLDENASKEEEEKVREKALNVLKKAKEGENFAKLAKTYSEDPGTKEDGDLGYFSPGQMVRPFEEAAFKMEKGEISDLVRTPFGYHIIKVEDVKEARTKSFEEVRHQIEEPLIRTGAADLAHEKALTFLDQMPYQADLKPYSSEHKAIAKETDFFSQNDPIPGIGGDERLKQTILSLGKGDVSEVLEYQGKFYVVQVTDRKASTLPSFEQAAEKVKADYASYLAMSEAKSAAERFLAKLKVGRDWPALCKENHVEPKTTEFFSRQDPVQEFSAAPEVREGAFALSQNKRYPDSVFEDEKGALVIRWEGQQGIDQKKYEEEKENYRDMLARVKQQTVFNEWLENLRKSADIRMMEAIEGVDAGG